MKRLVVPALTLLLAACGTTQQPVAHTPPSPAIVALANPPGLQLRPPPSASPPPVVSANAVTEHQHAHWSISVPTSWQVSDDTEDSLNAISDTKFGRAQVAVSVLAAPVGKDVAPEQFAALMSVMAPSTLVPEGQEIEHVGRHMIEFNGVPASVTTVITKEGIGIGILSLEQVTTHTGYVLGCVGDAAGEGVARLCASIHKTFKLR